MLRRYTARVWNGHACYACDEPGPVLLIFDSDGYGSTHSGNRKIGEAVRAKYPFFRPGHSNFIGRTYYANHCEECGALQGDAFILDWAMASGRYDAPDETFDLTA